MARRLPSIRSTADGELADASRPGLHRTHIALLAQSRHREVRQAIARRDDVPLGIQAALANDDWHEVRATMAANPRAALSVLESLCGDRHHAVLLALVGNPSLPFHVAERLAFNKRQDVRLAAAARIDEGTLARAHAGRDEDHLIPELRERAASFAGDADGVADAPGDARSDDTALRVAPEAPPEPEAALEGPTEVAPGAMDAKAHDTRYGAIIELMRIARVPVPQDFEPTADNPLDDPERVAGATTHPDHDFLVVTLPDTPGPLRGDGTERRESDPAPMLVDVGAAYAGGGALHS